MCKVKSHIYGFTSQYYFSYFYTMTSGIILFDDNDALRYSLKVLFNDSDQYRVIGDYPNCDHVEEIMKTLQPDIILMDIDMPGTNGIEGLKKIKEIRPQTAIIMHTVFEDDQKLFECLCSGANGYLLKNTSFLQLIHALDEVMLGGAPMSPSIARKVLQSFYTKPKYDLTQREKDVLEYLVKGYSYKMIANSLYISLATVQSHIKNIYTKLHVNCGREAVVIALRDKIV